MIAVWIVLFIVSLAQFFFVLALSALIRAQREDREDHAKCTALLASFVGNEWAAHVLEVAAERYDSMDGQAEQRRIANTTWIERQGEGASIPSMWMRERAAETRAVNSREEVGHE